MKVFCFDKVSLISTRDSCLKHVHLHLPMPISLKSLLISHKLFKFLQSPIVKVFPNLARLPKKNRCN